MQFKSRHVVHVNTQSFNATVTAESRPGMLIAFYDTKSMSTAELVPFLDEIADGLAKLTNAGDELGKLGVCDVTVNTFLGRHQVPEMMASWQKFSDEGKKESFKFGKPRYFPLIILFYRDGSRVEEYTGVVKLGNVVSYLRRQRVPLGGVPLNGPHEVREYLGGEGPYALGCGLPLVGEAAIKAAAKAAATRKAEPKDVEGDLRVHAEKNPVTEEDIFQSWAQVSTLQHGALYFGRAASSDCELALGLEPSLSTPVRVIWARGSGVALGTAGGQSGAFSVMADAATLGSTNQFLKWLGKRRSQVLEEMTPDNSHVFLEKPMPLVVLLTVARGTEKEVSSRLFEEIEDADGMEYFQFVWSDCEVFGSQFNVEDKCPVVLLVDPESLKWETASVDSFVRPESNGGGVEAPSQRLLSWLWRSSHKFGFPANSTAWEAAMDAEGSRRQAKNSSKTNETTPPDEREVEGPDIRNASAFEDALVQRNARVQMMSLTNVEIVLDLFAHLLAHFSELRIGFEAHYSHIDFDWSALEKAQALHPKLRMHAETYEDVARIMEDPKLLQQVRKDIEAQAKMLKTVEELHSGKQLSKTKKFAEKVNSLHKAAKQGCALLTELHQRLFRTLHALARRGSLGVEPPPPKPVERRAASELSVREFVEEFAEKRKPVVITGLKLDEEEPWTLDFFKDRCNVSVKLRSLNLSKRSWGRLQPAGELRLPEFIDSFRSNKTRRHWYLHDWSLPGECPRVFGPPPYKGFTMPKYFAGDYFQRAAFDGYQHSWPSLFIGSNETESSMHIDSGGTHFWLHLLSGRKRWAFYSAEDTINVYKSPLGHSFAADPFRPDFENLPLHRFAQQYHVTQEAGELMFVPAGNPHAVQNLEDIHGVSMNYVDITNIQLHLWHALVEQRWVSFEFFTDASTVPQGLRSDQEHLRFGDWKSQPWHEFTYDI